MKFTIRQARTYRGYTQGEMAQKLGVTKVTYINYEKGRTKMKVDRAAKFAQIVDLPRDKIIFLSSY